MSAPRVLIYVQYLEGIGHAVRASRIAEALHRQGASVTLVLGGEPVPDLAPSGCQIVQLPPLRATPESYSHLIRPDGSPVDETYKAGRRDLLLATFARVAPDVLLTEGYPFGRWAMEFELGPLLDTAEAIGSGRPLILASLRDILQVPNDPAKVDRSIAIYGEHFDAMLVHGDPRLIPIEASFPAIKPFLETVHYTGLVAAGQGGATPPPAAQCFDVIVSAGGGAIAEHVLAAAIAAKPLSDLAQARWLALTGPRLPEVAFARLEGPARAYGVTLERYRPGLAGLMAGAQLSIQRAGYNTVTDLLIAGCRAVLIPDSDHRQREQPLRAERLEALGRAVVCSEAGLAPVALADAIARAQRQQIAAIDLDLDGAATSARRVMALWASHEAGQRGAKDAGR